MAKLTVGQKTARQSAPVWPVWPSGDDGDAFQRAASDYLAGHSAITSADLACRYIAMHVRRDAGRRWLQGAFKPALPCASQSLAVRLFAERRLRGVPEPVARGLVAWARGEWPIVLLFHVPTTRDVLALQARGRRCVSLLDETTPAHPHKDGLAFAIHDLCHAEKFFEPGQHEAQVGFFDAVHRATLDPRWEELDSSLDAEWIEGRDHVMADMNGSAVFLLLALKSKLKMAVNRRLAKVRGEGSAAFRPRDLHDTRECDTAQGLLLDLLGLKGELVEAARALASKGGASDAEIRLFHHFRERGQTVLGACAPEAADAPLRDARDAASHPQR